MGVVEEPRSCGPASGDGDEDNGDVVLSAAVVCGAHQFPAGDTRVVIVVEDGLDVFVLDLSPETVGTQQDLISLLEFDAEDEDEAPEARRPSSGVVSLPAEQKISR